MAVTASNSDPVLQVKDVSKRFGATQALAGASLTIQHGGTVHGLIGENGSGKSTLLGLLSAQIQPDSGSIFLNGQRVVFPRPSAALDHGIAMVSQETALALDLSVAENILLGHQVKAGPVVEWKRTRARAAQTLKQLGLDYDPRALVRGLRPDQRQMVEIARAISTQARVLILDEPTSSLSDDQVQTLFAVVRQLKTRDVSTIFVSHRMAELFELCDEITVLRDGRTVASGATSSFTRDSLVEAMVGSPVAMRSGASTGGHPGPTTVGEPALVIDNVSVASTLSAVSLTVAPGEIVGLAGLVGAGRSELLETVFGVRPHEEGTITVRGKQLPSRPRDCIEHGLGFLPPDRKEEGLVQSMSVRDNMVMVASSERFRMSYPSIKTFDDKVRSTRDQMRIKTPSFSTPVSSLSGGNQQKVAVAKWLTASTQILLLDEPTRGVDIRSKKDIHSMLKIAARDGMALLVSSSENEELLELCDRIVVMARGRVVATVQSRDANEALLTGLAGGHAG